MTDFQYIRSRKIESGLNKIQRNKIKSNKTSPQLKMANKAKKVQDKVQHVEYYSKRGAPTI